MKSGKCPKCGSTTVYTKLSGLGLGDHQGVYVFTGMVVMISKTVAYICTTCGYFESYIYDPSKLAEVAQKWQKVPPSA